MCNYHLSLIQSAPNSKSKSPEASHIKMRSSICHREKTGNASLHHPCWGNTDAASIFRVGISNVFQMYSPFQAASLPCVIHRDSLILENFAEARHVFQLLALIFVVVGKRIAQGCGEDMGRKLALLTSRYRVSEVIKG